MVRLVAESVSLSEVVSRLGIIRHMINETLRLSEVVTRLGSLSRYVNETIQMPETIYSGFMAMVRVVSESISIQSFDGLKARVMVRVINEILQIPSVATSTFYSMVQIINESLGISDLATRFGTMKRIVSESLSLPELIKTPLKILLAINEGMSISSGIVSSILAGLVTVGRVLRTSDVTKKGKTTDKTLTGKTYKRGKTIEGGK
jgi:hypothetical protein